jgi:hypothetical protein
MASKMRQALVKLRDLLAERGLRPRITFCGKEIGEVAASRMAMYRGEYFPPVILEPAGPGRWLVKHGCFFTTMSEDEFPRLADLVAADGRPWDYFGQGRWEERSAR